MTDHTDTRPEFMRMFWPDPHKPRDQQHVPRALPSEKTTKYAAAALNSEVDKLARAGEGQRNDQLNLSAFALAQLVAAGYLDRNDTWHALNACAVAVGLTSTETVNTLRSAFGAGELLPRDVPDSTEAYDAPAVTYLHLVDGQAPGVTLTDPEPEGIRDLFPAIDWAALWADEREDEWIAEPLIPARRLVALFSPPKVGKSLLMLELAVKVSLGVSVLGSRVDRPVRVLYVDFENDPRGDVRSRLKAMGYSPYQLDNLVYLSFPKLAYLDTTMGGLTLLAVAQEYGAELVIIDTISRAIQGEENANDTWLAFYRNTGVRLKDAGIACVRLDHTGKDESKGMRGGSAKYGDVDAVWALSRVSDDLFRLTCTANRLPIAQKVVTLRRNIGPLRHDIDMDGRRADVLAAEQALEALGVEVSASLRDAYAAIEASDNPFGRNVTHEAQRNRKERPAATTWAYREDDDDA